MPGLSSSESDADSEYVPTEEGHSDTQTLSVDTPAAVDSWDSLFGGVSLVADGGNPTLDELVNASQSGILDTYPSTLPEDWRVNIPRVEPGDFRNHAVFRADVDSIKGLVHIKYAAHVFHPGTDIVFTNGMIGRHGFVDVDLCTCLPLSSDHLRGVGIGGARLRMQPASLLSVPKIPKPTEVWPSENYRTREWPFPSPAETEPLEWVSLADVPHFLLGEAKGLRKEELLLWCICPVPYGIQGAVSRCKAMAQRVLYLVKAMASDALSSLLLRSTEVGQRARQLTIDPSDLSGIETVVYTICTGWHYPDQDEFVFLEVLHAKFVRWTLFEERADFQHRADRYTLPPAALDIICNLFHIVVTENRLQVEERDRNLLKNCMVYIDAKGMKEKVSSASLRGSLEPNIQPLVEAARQLVPSLSLVCRGLCRVDVGYEWMMRGGEEAQALLWSIGNHERLLATMPRKWSTHTRLYNSLGLAEIVDLQAHVLYWIPPPPWEDYHLGHLPCTAESCLPSRRGPCYMDVPIPLHALEEGVRQFGSINRALFQGVSVINIYCPGPRKVASSFGRSWGLDLDGPGPLLALLALIGEAEGIRRDIGSQMGTVEGVARGFIRHIDREIPNQRAWSIRAEVGAQTIAEACRFLEWYARENALDHDTVALHGQGIPQLREHFRPFTVPLSTLGRYMSSAIEVWLLKLKMAGTSFPMDKAQALLGATAEHALKNVSYLFRGRNSWPPSLAKMFLHGGLLRHGILLPTMVHSVIEGLPEPWKEKLLSVVNRAFNDRILPSKKRIQVNAMGRMLESTRQVKQLLQEANERGPHSAEQRYKRLCAHLLSTFYHDLHTYLVTKRHWHPEAPRPAVLSEGQDCVYDVENQVVRLANPLYNLKVTNPSVVHPKTGTGRRSITSMEFLDRWFPNIPKGDRAPRLWETNRQTNWFVCTLSLWDFILSNLGTDRLKACRQVLDKMVTSARTRQLTTPGDTQGIRLNGILVPDGTGPRRPFRTLNSWVEVVGPGASPFIPPRQRERVPAEAIPVTRAILSQEYDFFALGARRGFNEHELNVFSMFVLLEGGEERLNNISAAATTRTCMGHMEAFLDDAKATLYCFRVRRTVQQITEKFNAACKASLNSPKGWSLREIVQRLQNCLGEEFLDEHGRINKEAAHRWLVANKSRTLREYRRGFSEGVGPAVTERIRDAWNAHQDKTWSHPIPTELLPLGTSSPQGENEDEDMGPEPNEHHSPRRHVRDRRPWHGRPPHHNPDWVAPRNISDHIVLEDDMPSDADAPSMGGVEQEEASSVASLDNEPSTRQTHASFFENRSAFE